MSHHSVLGPVLVVVVMVGGTVCPAAGQPAPMVLIPGGEFQMGDHFGEGDSHELPVHSVYVNRFYMDSYEVTNEEYCTYLNSAYPGETKVVAGIVYGVDDSDNNYPYCATNDHHSQSQVHWDGSAFSATPGREDHPMADVSWFGAAVYANWKSAQEGRQLSYSTVTWDCDFEGNGYRLPTEVEWEYAARGGEHASYFRYSWGDTIDGFKANYDGSADPYECGEKPWTTPVGFYNGGLHERSDFAWPCDEVGSYQTSNGCNDYALCDMAGNVYEWCNDWYSAAYYASSPYDNPHGPLGGAERVLRGGSWFSIVYSLRCAYRAPRTPAELGSVFGFRLVVPTGDIGIPTVSEWGTVVMTLLVLTAGTLVYARQRPARA